MKETKVHLRFDATTGEHTRVTIFMRGANVGQLTLRSEEATWLHHILQKGCDSLELAFVSSGRAPDVVSRLLDECARDLRKRS